MPFIYLLIYLITYIKKHRPPSEANRFSASPNFPTLYGTWIFIPTFTRALQLSPILRYLNSAHTTKSHSWKSILIIFSIYAWVSQVELFPQVSTPKALYNTLQSPTQATSPPILFFSISLTKRFWVGCCDH